MLPGVETMPVGSAPIGRKFAPGSRGFSSSTEAVFEVVSTTATSPRVGLGDERVEVRDEPSGVDVAGVVLGAVLVDGAHLLLGALGERPLHAGERARSVEADERGLAGLRERSDRDERGGLRAAAARVDRRDGDGAPEREGREGADRSARRAPSPARASGGASRGTGDGGALHLDSSGAVGVPMEAKSVPKVVCRMSRSTTPMLLSVKCPM